MTACSVAGCEREHIASGLCNMHYKRLRANGDPLITIRRPRHTGWLDKDGYFVHSINGRRIRDHIAIAEKALGKRLPPGAQVHHVDEDRTNNQPGNLVICPNNAYHKLLHQRMRAVAACGNANWLPCKRCHQYADPDEMANRGSSFAHRLCEREYEKNRPARQR